MFIFCINNKVAPPLNLLEELLIIRFKVYSSSCATVSVSDVGYLVNNITEVLSVSSSMK